MLLISYLDTYLSESIQAKKSETTIFAGFHELTFSKYQTENSGSILQLSLRGYHGASLGGITTSVNSEFNCITVDFEKTQHGINVIQNSLTLCLQTFQKWLCYGTTNNSYGQTRT